jgi:AhpD family alkylhydroperoxidase
MTSHSFSKKLVVSLFTLMAVASPHAQAAGSNEPSNPEARAAYAEAKAMLGVVPAALRAMPDETAGQMWDQLKAIQLNPNTALSGKFKELVGAGVAAQIPCSYCEYFHQEAAKLNGATQNEIKEAIGVAALARHWATVVDGQVPAGKDAKPEAAPVELQSTYKDIEATFGSVPDYLRRYPAVAIVPAWKLLKTTLLGSQGSLSTKERALLSLAVASQIPSVPCVQAYTDLSKKLGANDREIQEAIAMAAMTRAGSTVLNGYQMDQAAFRKEVDGIIRHVKKAMSGKMAQR